jgi:two-component system chemotaxis response regulator CheB
MIRVLVAEDSLTVRQLLVDLLRSDHDITVIGEAKDGAEAIALADELKPSLIVMDVHMPAVDGLAATKEIMVRAPAPIILMSSTTNPLDVELALNAMRAGALMVVAKPDDPGSSTFSGRREQLLLMIKAMAEVKVVRRWAPKAQSPAAQAAWSKPATSVRLVAIAASTGGPAVLQRILADLPGDFQPPILAVQHIAVGFVHGLAEWLNASSALRVKVAGDGEALEPHVAYLAADGKHLGVRAPGRIELSDEPPVGGFRPSGTYLFESAARLRGPAVAAVILTGMGSDGVAGLHKVREAGGTVLAQDEESSVVFGMPRDAVAAGVVNAVLGVEQIAPRLVALARET